MPTHGAHAHRWAERMAGRTSRDNFARGNSNVFAERDIIYSYGHHFEIAKGLRDAAGRVVLILVNGDTFSPTTTQHQSTVRSAIAGTGLPSVIIPFSALDQAGISHDTVRIVEVTKDRHESWIETCHTVPSDPEAGWYRERDEAGQTVWRRQRYRHWLGESLITADVRHRALIKCPTCRGTGQVEPHFEHYDGQAEGPLTRRQDQWHYSYFYDPEWKDDGRQIPARAVSPVRLTTQCERCIGSRKVETTRMRSAYFLSGFDRNETRPSYFFTELPPKAKPTTIEEALDSLKPQAVRLAESLGREVKRQGDVFCIPMPGLTLRQLRKEKGELVKMGSLFNTNHAATDTFITSDGRTYIRGVLRHVPAGRRPDHVRVNVGKTWHLAIKNLTPVSI